MVDIVVFEIATEDLMRGLAKTRIFISLGYGVYIHVDLGFNNATALLTQKPMMHSDVRAI